MRLFDPQFALDVLLPVNTAAYQFAWNQTMVLPKDWNPVAKIALDPKKIGGDHDAPMTAIAVAEDCNWGVVAKKDDIDTAVIAVRGTQTRHQWLEDFEAFGRPIMGHRGFIHSGFMEVFTALESSIDAAYQTVKDVKRIVITGHSLGAAIALIAGVKYSALNANVETITFAGPRVYSSLSIKFDCYRVVNHWDIVPNVPLPPLYMHLGTAIPIDSGFTLDPHVAHSLALGYAPGLKKLFGLNGLEPRPATRGTVGAS